MRILFISLMLTSSFAVHSQPPGGVAERQAEMRRRVESMEVAYMTRELNLSTEDAQKFWPVFNKYREEMKAVHGNAAITDPLDRQQKLLDIRKKYRGDFNRTLGQERGTKVFQSEDRFRQMAKGAAEMRMEARRRMAPGQGQNPRQNMQRLREYRQGGGFR